jgi:hypothetical protein
MAFGGHLGHARNPPSHTKIDLDEASPSHERSNIMSDITNEQTEDEIISSEISDESLEAAAFIQNLGVYTQFAFCTYSGCPS